jgi:hypothetical protein
VTFLDHIARPGEPEAAANDPQYQRAAAWLSLYLPGYADTEVGIASVEAEHPLPAQRDLLASWTPPHDPPDRFPNADRYVVDMRHPDDHVLPARSTATNLQAHWLGGVDPAWGGLLRSDPADPVRVEVDRAGNEVLRGTILNELPGDLGEVKLIWIWSRREPPRRYAVADEREQPWVQPTQSGRMLNVGRMYAEPVIGRGAAYRIPQSSAAAGLSLNVYDKYVKRFEGSSAASLPGRALTQADRRLYHEMLGIYRQLAPPKYLKSPEGNNPDTMIARRMLGRELDLSAWFGRPCLILIGHLEDAACPIPLRVDGRPVESRGTTVVRWIHPLPLLEEIAFASGGAPPAGEAGSSGAESE